MSKEPTIEMCDGHVILIENVEATIIRLSGSRNGSGEFYGYVLDAPLEGIVVWASDEIKLEVLRGLNIGSRIVFCAELDEENDMVMTKCEHIKHIEHNVN